MIRVRLQIPGVPSGVAAGDIVDTQEYGFIYLDSDKRVGAPSKAFEATSYPEEEGEHIIPKTVDAAFDYVVKFFIQADSLENANDKIAAFNQYLYDDVLDDNDQPTGVKEYKQVTFYNDYKRHKIVGYPSPISEATDFWRDRTNQLQDIIIIEWKIRVTKPSLCDFNLEPEAEETT